MRTPVFLAWVHEFFRKTEEDVAGIAPTSLSNEKIHSWVLKLTIHTFQACKFTSEIAHAYTRQAKLTEKRSFAAFTNPEAHLRRKFLSAIDKQIAAAEARSQGQPFIRRGKRWLPNSETGERALKEGPVRFLPWWWQDKAGKPMLAASGSS